MNYTFTNYDEVRKNAESLMETNRKEFTLNKMSVKFDEIINEYYNPSSQVGLTLPKLKKTGNSDKETCSPLL